MEYNLKEQLCIDIYNYLEKQPSGETGVMFALLKQSMEQQAIEKQRQEREDKLRAEIAAETESTQESIEKKVE